MGATRVVFTGLVLSSLLLGCGHKKPATKTAKKAKKTDDTLEAPPPAETEKDREDKRKKAALAIIPEGSACLPTVLRDTGAPKLELGAVDGMAMLCAIDQDRSRLLGPVGCWKVDLATSAISYESPRPIPGAGFQVRLDERCARGYCLPADAPIPSDGLALITWDADGKKVGLLAGDKVHVFDAETKAQASEFSIRGDKGVPGDTYGIHWVGDAIFIEGGDAGAHSVFVFKPDGTQQGPIEVLGGKAGTQLTLRAGAISILDKQRIGLTELGLSTMTTYEVDNGKRTKVVRKVAKPPCKADDMEAYWKDAQSVSDAKCKEAMAKAFGYFIGADGIAGSKNLLFVLRGPRLGELGVVDPKSLQEQKKVIKLPWCGEAAPADK